MPNLSTVQQPTKEPQNETLTSRPRPDFLARMGHWETSIGAYTQYTAGKFGQPCHILGTFRCNIEGEPDTDGDWYCYPEPDRKWRECYPGPNGHWWERNRGNVVVGQR